MSDATCETCPWFRRARDGDWGECHKNPPTTILMHWPETGGEFLETVWPNVGLDDWCGEGRER